MAPGPRFAKGGLSVGRGWGLATQDQWGHVNVTELGIGHAHDDLSNYAAIGAHLQLQILGRAMGQLRLAAI